MIEQSTNFPRTSRRDFMRAGTALSMAGVAPGAASALVPDAGMVSVVAADLDRYIAFGNKQAGGAGDVACGDWLAGELGRIGYAIEKQDVSVPFFEPARCELASGSVHAEVWAQPIVMPTDPSGVTGPLVHVDAAGHWTGTMAGAIALVELPFSRWSTMMAKPVREPVSAAFAAGATAAVVITTGPTGDVIALNADGRKPMFPAPVALLAPRSAGPFVAGAASRASATLHLEGHSGRRRAFNFVGRIDRGRGRWLAVSTPRSGWFGCAAERGPGVAAWLQLARWAAQAVKDYDLAFICNSGHEYEYLGASEALGKIAPPVSKTALWLHLGANVCARDWHEIPDNPRPLPSTDPQRFLSVTPELLPLAKRNFVGLAGLETPYSSEELSAGEQTEILTAGYQAVAAVFGIHRYHHGKGDDARCVDAAKVAATAVAFKCFLLEYLSS